jgi:hypothetical protein
MNIKQGSAAKAEGGIFESRTDEKQIDAAFIIYRLEEAGATLLALPGTGYSTKMRVSHLDVVPAAIEAYGSDLARVRPPTPSASRITRMDEALGWITLIPAERRVIRRIIGARSLVSPVTERHLFSWRRLGEVMGADHKAVQRWHGQGIDMLVAAVAVLNRRRPGVISGRFEVDPSAAAPAFPDKAAC